jgi:cyclophilin family peptidyl-prolyl cis-trans isomerase
VVTKKQRQRQLARQKWVRQRTRQVEHRRRARRNGIIIGTVVAVIAVIAGGVGLFLLLRDDSSAHAAAVLTPGHDPGATPGRMVVAGAPGRVVVADGENRNDSGFVITYGDPFTIDHRVTAFGKVNDRLDGGTMAAKAGLAPDSGTQGLGRPATSVIIEDVKVTTT